MKTTSIRPGIVDVSISHNVTPDAKRWAEFSEGYRFYTKHFRRPFCFTFGACSIGFTIILSCGISHITGNI